jgi:hypothetical protein
MSKKFSQLPPIFSKLKFLSLLLLFALLLSSCNKSGSSNSGGSGDISNSDISSNSGTNNSDSSSNSSGGKSFNSAEELKEYLDKQPANSPDKPIKVTVSANASTLPKIVEVIDSSGKYVSLNISGNALTTIPRSAFYGCRTMLVSVTIPNGVKTIDYWAFKDCTNLKSVTIPNSVTSIGSNAFNNCTSLTSIAVPKSVKEIGEGAFSKCTNLTSVKFENTYSRNLVSADFDKAYWNGGRQTGTYTRPSAKSSTWTNTSPPSFPSAFRGTWSKVNFNAALTFEANSVKFKASNKNPSWVLSSTSGDLYTVVAESNPSFSSAITIKIVSGSLDISGDDSGNNWNGTWKKQ